MALPAELVEAIAQRAAELIAERAEQRSPWLTRRAAAEYLGVPVTRLEKDRTVPAHRWDGRVLYHRGELDEWVLSFGR
jgi:hypothetical protein